jgi:hypothetical protein
MTDDSLTNNIMKLFIYNHSSGYIPSEATVGYMELTSEEVLTCAGLIIAASPKWSAQRDIITNLLLHAHEASIESVLMFLDTKVLDSAIPQC